MSANDGEPVKKKKKRVELPIVPIKNTSDYQKMKLDRLMANIDKPVAIPVKRGEKNLPPPPDFVRNIMGSSAGAGSGEFHVYRHLRRKEYARQKTILEQAKQEEQEAEFAQKVSEKQKLADEKTAKKREKRLKKKAARKKNRGKQGSKAKESSSSESEDDEEEETAHIQKPDGPAADGLKAEAAVATDSADSVETQLDGNSTSIQPNLTPPKTDDNPEEPNVK